MNDLDALAMSEKVHHLEETWAQIGCTMPSPFMTMALIPLACLPELRLTNRGSWTVPPSSSSIWWWAKTSHFKQHHTKISWRAPSYHGCPPQRKRFRAYPYPAPP